jgi:hypothetical protein
MKHILGRQATNKSQDSDSPYGDVNVKVCVTTNLGTFSKVCQSLGEREKLMKESFVKIRENTLVTACGEVRRRLTL